MRHRNLIIVPGKNPKPPPQQHRQLLWRTLVEGVKRAEPNWALDLAKHKHNFKLIAWNHLYYEAQKDSYRDLTWVEALIHKHGPTDQDIKQAHAWHKNLTRVFYTLADKFPIIIYLVRGHARESIKETKRYFENKNNIATKIREQLKRVLRPMLDNNEPVLIIGHSMGSIITYDALWELSHHEENSGQVDFLSVGSPLGINFVQHRLLGNSERGKRKYPTLIRRWYNITAVGDLTALDQHFHDDFKPMIDAGIIESIEDHADGIYNFFRTEKGLNCHRSYGYLVNPVVGKVIADWWQIAEQY